MAAVNDLCQYHAMSHNIPRVTYYHDRYLFRIRRPRSKPPDEDDDDNSSQNSTYSMMAYNVEINGNRRGHHPRQRSKYQHHDLRAWLPDSGATDHFTNNLNDLHDTVACRRKVTVADGTVVYATAHGKCNLLMRDDVTKTPLRYTMRVYYVPGLTQRLFSFREFLRHPNHQIHQTSRFIQLDFGNGCYFTTPAVLGSQHQSNVNTALTLYQLPRNSQNSTVRTVDERETHKVASPKPLPRMQMDIAHARFGHRAYISLLCASLHHVWDDYLIVPASDDYCEGCKIAASRSAPRSQRGTPTPKAPFERIFIDIIPTPSGADGLTKDSAYPCYLLIVDHYSRFTWFEGMLNYTSQQVITCLKQFMVETRSLGRTKQIQYLRGDSDSSFRSAEFLSFAEDSNIAASFAAPHHQEMNSICEGTWRTLDTMARAMRIHARLGNNFFGHSCRYAAHILNRLCPKGLLDENNNPTTPYYMAFGRKPRIGNIKVFGCPVSFRRYEPSNKGQRIPKKQQTQRSSIRGIFLGFPPKQAGYLIYLEDRIGTTHIMVSQDVTFDETFKSALATTYRPFQGAQFIRPVGDETMRSEIANHDDPDNETNPLATGSVDDILHPRIESSARGENTMETIVEEDIDTATDPAEISSDGVLPTHYYDEILDYVKNKNGTYKFQVQWNNGDITWEPEQYLREDSPGEFAVFLRETGLSDLKRFAWAEDFDESHPDTSDDADANSTPTTTLTSDNPDDQSNGEEAQTPDELQPPINSKNRYNLRSRKTNHELFAAYAAFRDAFDTEPDPTLSALATAANRPDNHPVSLFLPEPTTFHAVLRQPPEIMKAWLASIESELRNLIVTNKTFIKEMPRAGERSIPTKLVCKAKSLADGTLDKLKARIVARGDLQKDNDWQDTWSACASIRTVKLFLAFAASLKRRVKHGDFVGAYLQAKVRGRFFVTLDKRYAQYFPDLADWFGRPLLLDKGIYGLTYSGKFWNEEFSEWLIGQGFVQSTADTTYFIKYYKDGSWIRLIFYVDDCLYFGSSDAIEKEFEKSVASRFNIDYNGQANWFLQMRIYQYEDFSVSIDQTRYTKVLLRKYCPDNAPFGTPKHRNTPAPPKYLFSKENRPSPEEKAKLAKDYEGLDFRSAVCSLLYLALGTRGDILFIVNKLAKACTDPGRKDFEALLWLFGYLRAEPAWGSKYYANLKQSPIHDLLTRHETTSSELVVFTDASWQDCPDTGRSTTGYLIFYRGGVIEANSMLQTPVAMSSCEAEVMAACSGSMAAAHLHMLLYDMKYLGTKRYNNSQLALPNPPTVVMVDNEAACKMSLNDKLTTHTRHISRRFHYVRQGSKMKLHVINWCPGEDMLSDIMTKSTEPSKTTPHRDRAYYKMPKFLEQ